MKTYDLATGALVAALIAIVAQGQHVPEATLADCDRVAITNDAGQVLYYNLADATCGAQFENEDAPEEPEVEEVEVEEPAEPEEPEEPEAA